MLEFAAENLKICYTCHAIGQRSRTTFHDINPLSFFPPVPVSPPSRRWRYSKYAAAVHLSQLPFFFLPNRFYASLCPLSRFFSSSKLNNRSIVSYLYFTLSRTSSNNRKISISGSYPLIRLN